MKKKIYVISMFIILALAIFIPQVQARIVTNDPTVESGGTITLTVTSQETVYGYAVTIGSNTGLIFQSATGGEVNGTKVAGISNSGTTNLATYTFRAPEVTNDTTYTVVFNGTDIILDVSGDTTTSSQATASVKVKAKQNPTPTPEPEPTPTPTPDPEPTFRSVNETVYVKSSTSINVRASYSTTSKVVGSLKTGEAVTRIGIGENGWSRVSFNGSTAYISTALLTTEKPEEDKPLEEPTTTKSNNTNLKSLSLKAEGLTPNFSSTVLDYTLKLETKVEQLEVAAIAEDTKSTVKVEGNTSMTEGENKITITVTAEDGTIKKYTIKVANGVTEAITGETEELQLKKLEIKGVNIGTVFNPAIFEYTITVKDVSSLEITAEANQEDAKIEILGNKDFKDGENVITIVVKSKDGTETATYQIIVKKTAVVGQTENSNWQTFAIIGGIVALLIIIVVAVIIIKRRKENENTYEDDEEEVENLGYKERYAKFEEPEDLFGGEIVEEKPKRDSWFEDEIEEEEEDTTTKRKRGKHF